MKLKKLDKNIMNFVYSLQQKPGFTKRKSLLQYLHIDDSRLDESVNRLILHGYMRISQKPTSHEGACYELTGKGLEIWEGLNKSILEKINSNLNTISIIAIIGFLISYLLNLFSPEIKTFLLNIFN